jgi:nucleotide-binding universal stress UspA family protein
MSDRAFQKILVPVDGSHPSIHAEEYAAMIAKKLGSKVTCIHVVSHGLMHPTIKSYSDLPSSVLEEINGWFEQKGRSILRDAEALFKEEGLESNTMLEIYDDPAERIIQVSRDGGYDLIVMGNHGTRGVVGFSLGDVTEKVSRHAECPVFIVKRKADISNILAAVDGSEKAKDALKRAVQLALVFDSKITLLNVVEAAPTGVEPSIADNVGRRILSEAASEVEGVELEERLGHGHPAENILRVAKSEGHELIVLGNRGLSRIHRFFLGSISDKVSRHAECSVLIVK